MILCFKIGEGRLRLPIAAFKDAITSTIESHQVVLISGETGCGKTTQVPQYLLDYMWGKHKTCKIICTQPRRISATSVAERISHERGEDVGDTVGYKIRLESKGGKNSSIVFCTNGLLLRVLVSKGTTSKADALSISEDTIISSISHIIVDEIHERDCYSDFMLAILRDMLPSYPHLHLVLMSATLDAERFSQYFGGCPVIRVAGFTHPVKTFFLEDVIGILKSKQDNHLDSSSSVSIEDSELSEEYRHSLDEAINLACTNDEYDTLLDLVSFKGTSNVFNYQHSSTGVTSLMVFSSKGRVGDVCMLLSLGADCHLQANDGSTALEWAEQENQVETAELIKKHMENALSDSKEMLNLLDKYMESIDVVLIEQLLRRICDDSENGAILVFLPGWDDINRIYERLQSSSVFSNTSKFLIIPLHSMLPSVEQKKVFKRPSKGCRKIVLSTNIAETAVTIDDIVYVIDSGRMKEKNYDPYSNVSTLQSSWVSKASATQRQGRAGRCQPGICYHLYSKIREASLSDFPVPEIKRMPIVELCLQMKLVDPYCKAEVFLQKLLDPPVSETIHNAIVVLQDIGALTYDENLTELGEKLGSLPVHPLTSKMLFYAILLNCLDPALTLACASDFKDPFTLSMPQDRKKAAAAKVELAKLYGGHSDQLALIAAFECWRAAKENGQEKRFCSEYFISSGTMHMLLGMRKQLQNELIRKGFIPEDTSRCSLNARDPGILHAVLVAGLYPMVGRLRTFKRSKRSLVETASGEKVRLHPASSISKLSFKNPDSRPLIMYDEIIRGDSGLSTRNCTLVGPLPLLLIATEMVVAPGKDNEGENDVFSNDDSEDDELGKGNKSRVMEETNIMSSPDNTVRVVVDRWLSFETTALDVAQIYCLRESLAAATLFKVKHPHQSLPPFLEASVFALTYILSYDGLSNISLPLESVVSLTSMVSATKIDKSVPEKRNMALDLHGFLQSLMGYVPHNRPDNHMTTTLPLEFKRQQFPYSTSHKLLPELCKSQSPSSINIKSGYVPTSPDEFMGRKISNGASSSYIQSSYSSTRHEILDSRSSYNVQPQFQAPRFPGNMVAHDYNWTKLSSNFMGYPNMSGGVSWSNEWKPSTSLSTNNNRRPQLHCANPTGHAMDIECDMPALSPKLKGTKVSKGAYRVDSLKRQRGNVDHLN